MTRGRPGAAAAEPANGPQVDVLGTVINQATYEFAAGCQACGDHPDAAALSLWRQGILSPEIAAGFLTAQAEDLAVILAAPLLSQRPFHPQQGEQAEQVVQTGLRAFDKRLGELAAATHWTGGCA
jgi:hypothetical protein